MALPKARSVHLDLMAVGLFLYMRACIHNPSFLVLVVCYSDQRGHCGLPRPSICVTFRKNASRMNNTLLMKRKRQRALRVFILGCEKRKL